MNEDIGFIGRQLQEWGVISDDIEIFHKGTRDNPEINVLQCMKSHVLFLDKIDKSKASYSHRKNRFETAYSKDNDSRVEFLKPLVQDKIWADVGAGTGGLIERLYRNTKETVAVEPADKYRKCMPVEAREYINQLEDEYYDFITLFHTLEHIPNQLGFLELLRQKLNSMVLQWGKLESGGIIIEVPHARDLLIDICPEFRDFTFWSEHLVLHTRQSLSKLLELAGFEIYSMENIQRYGLANHFNWLLNGKPNGEEVFKFLCDPHLESTYRSYLSTIGVSDTLRTIAYVR